MTEDNRPTTPAEQPESGGPQTESGSASSGERARRSDWFAGMASLETSGEVSGAGSGNEESVGDGQSGSEEVAPAEARTTEGESFAGAASPETAAPGTAGVGDTPDGDWAGEPVSGSGQQAGQAAGSAAEWLAAGGAVPAQRPTPGEQAAGEVPGRPGVSGNAPVGWVAGTPGELSGSPGVARVPGQSEGQGFGMPQGEWSAGPAQPPQNEWTGHAQPGNEWARPAQEPVVFGSAAGQAGGGGTPPGGYYLRRPSQPQPQPQPEPQRKGSGALVAGVAVLALLVGGGAGALGGYLVADSNTSNAPVTNALDEAPPADHTSSSAPAGSVEAVAQKVSPTVVQLQVEGRQAAGEGSGFIISSDGLIVTNNHVVEVAADSGKITAVFADGSQVPASIVGRDPTSDVAVVKAEGKTGLPTVDLGSSDALKVGEGVVAIGSPFELSGTVTSGIVSSLHRPTRAGGEDGSQATVMDAIQTDAAINPGNSGGPLVNMQGQVIGINSAIYSPQSSGSSQGGSVGIGFAIPINQARRTADEIVKTGKATQTVLGVSVRDNQDGGALIADVTGGGPGEQAGLKSGDVVTKLDDRRIDTSDALVAAVRSHKPGDKVRLELSNGSRTVEATLAGQTVEPQ
jgi:putative serine protease PepD